MRKRSKKTPSPVAQVTDSQGEWYPFVLSVEFQYLRNYHKWSTEAIPLQELSPFSYPSLARGRKCNEFH